MTCAKPVVRAVELPRSEWATRLNEFAAAHMGWLISLDVVGPRTKAGVAVEQMPLLAISVDDIGNAPRMTISVARSSTEYLAHVIDGVTHVSVDYTDEGAEAGVRVQSAGDVSTTLRLRVAVPPELVDHVWHP